MSHKRKQGRLQSFELRCAVPTSLVFLGFVPSTISLVATIGRDVAVAAEVVAREGVTKAEEELSAPKTRDSARVALVNFIVALRYSTI